MILSHFHHEKLNSLKISVNSSVLNFIYKNTFLNLWIYVYFNLDIIIFDEMSPAAEMLKE
jgi:hypothetical protein